MGVSTHIEAIIPVDGDKYRSLLAVHDACVQASIPLPQEVFVFCYNEHGERHINERGRVVDIPSAAKEGEIESDEGEVIDLTKLPEGVTKLRVYQSC